MKNLYICTQIYKNMETTKELTEITLPKDIIDISNAYINAGKDIFLVGGAVRDFIKGIVPKDWDLVTNALPDESYSCHVGGEKHDFSNPIEAFNGLLQYYGLSSDYGLESKAVYDYVKKIPGNFFTC